MSKRKFIKYDEIHPLLPTPEKQLIALNPSTKKAWLRALRSGDYKQGKAALRALIGEGPNNGECFCCLGVYADVVEPKAWKAPRYGGKCYTWHEAEGAFPVKWTKQQAAVFMQETKNYGTSVRPTDGVAWTLMKANDGIMAVTGRDEIKPATFEQIALWIERYL